MASALTGVEDDDAPDADLIQTFLRQSEMLLHFFEFFQALQHSIRFLWVRLFDLLDTLFQNIDPVLQTSLFELNGAMAMSSAGSDDYALRQPRWR